MREFYFTTITVNFWTSVFQDFPKTNDIILESFNYMSCNWKVRIYAFVIMRDHVHVVWSVDNSIKTIKEIVFSFKSFTSHKIIKILKTKPDYLSHYFTSIRKDRKYKFWKLKSLSIHLLNPNIVFQKINYIHKNPTKGNYKVCSAAEEYQYSSAKLYKYGCSEFAFLKKFSSSNWGEIRRYKPHCQEAGRL